MYKQNRKVSDCWFDLAALRGSKFFFGNLKPYPNLSRTALKLEIYDLLQEVFAVEVLEKNVAVIGIYLRLTGVGRGDAISFTPFLSLCGDQGKAYNN